MSYPPPPNEAPPLYSYQDQGGLHKYAGEPVYPPYPVPVASQTGGPHPIHPLGPQGPHMQSVPYNAAGGHPQSMPSPYSMPTGPVLHQPQPAYGHAPPPAEGAWINAPQGPSNCPRGLEYLTMIDQLLVHQEVELLEAFTGFETQNKYTVKNSLGQKVYFAAEDSDCCSRNCCGPLRSFDMTILDNYQNEVIHLNRPLACDTCWFPCCLQSMEVFSPPGTLIGKVEQNWSLLFPSFSVKNANGDKVLQIDGPFCTYSICGDVEFKVLSADGSTQVGKISKQWSGLAREMFTDADFFGITFPLDLDVRMKAVMLGACFLIDFMFFEKRGNTESDRPGML